jgi:enoyl-CoA hydratase/carnithine racemase
MPSITYSEENGIAVITIHNEPKRNAFSHAMTIDMGLRLKYADDNPAIKCVIITGAGDLAFSSGHDLQEMLAHREHAADPTLNEPFFLPAKMTTPTIAAINGYAFAAGFILALSCDFRVCSTNASFSGPGARIGLLPIGGQLSRLPALMPRSIAHEMLVTCREMKADEAHRIGFSNRLVPKGQALAASIEMASAITKNSSSVVRAIKQGLEIQLSAGVELAKEYEWNTGNRLQQEPDAEEGMRAFLEKRSPIFL